MNDEELRAAVRRYWENSEATQAWFDMPEAIEDTLLIQAWILKPIAPDEDPAEPDGVTVAGLDDDEE